MFNNFAELGEQPYSDNDGEWDDFVRNHPQGSILQTTNWARLKGRFGWKAARCWVKEDGQIVAGAQILIKSAKFGLAKMGYMPHGPICNDWNNPELVDTLINQIDWATYEKRVGVVKFEPVLYVPNDIETADYDNIVKKYQLRTDTDTVQPPTTMLIDITGTEEDMLARLKSKTRYNIRLAEKKEVTVRQGTIDDIPTFCNMMKTTGTRNVFGVHDDDYYRSAFEIFSGTDEVALLLAEFEGQPLAGVMAFTCGNQGSYLYGASNNEERNRMPTYAVQWEAIRWAKSRGCTIYDMWGLPDASAETLEEEFEERSDGLWGVYRFKRGWGGNVVRTVGCSDRVYNDLVYKLYRKQRGL